MEVNSCCKLWFFLHDYMKILVSISCVLATRICSPQLSVFPIPPHNGPATLFSKHQKKTKDIRTGQNKTGLLCLTFIEPGRWSVICTKDVNDLFMIRNRLLKSLLVLSNCGNKKLVWSSDVMWWIIPDVFYRWVEIALTM